MRKTVIVKTKIPSQSQGQFYCMEVKLRILIKQFFLGGSWEGNFKDKFRNEIQFLKNFRNLRTDLNGDEVPQIGHFAHVGR